MSVEISMWLYPIAIAAVVGLVMNLRYGWRWTWGICLQQVFILIAAILGFVFLYGLSNELVAAYCTGAAWLMFFVFNLRQRIQLNKLSLDLSLFRVQQALRRARVIRMTLWGPPGQYWCDIASALNLYHEDRVAEGDAIVEKWRSDTRLPLSARESLVGFHMLGRVLTGDWHSLINEFETNQNILVESRTFVPYQMAGRAYAELGRYAEAEQCMRKANMQPAKTSATNLDINFMTLFALFGAEEQLNSVLRRCRDFRALPQYVRDYWLGRCYAIRGDAPQAVQSLERCKRETPSDTEAWHRRIDRALALERAKTERLMPAANAAADPYIASQAEELYLRLRRIVEILRPQTTGNGVRVLVVLLVVAFAISQLDQSYVMKGQLSFPLLNKGEYYRTISYLFLHGGTAHLLLNSFALILFGRTVENLYGTAKFLVIFFISGILSGIVQVLLIPQDFVIGASGAILGVFGAATAALVKLKNVLPPAVRKAELRWMVSIAIAQVVFDQVVNAIAAFTDKDPNGVRIGSFAHLGGMIFGFAIGMALPFRNFSDDDR